MYILQNDEMLIRGVSVVIFLKVYVVNNQVLFCGGIFLRVGFGLGY